MRAAVSSILAWQLSVYLFHECCIFWMTAKSLFLLAFAFGEICFLSSLIPVVDRQCLALVRQCRKKKNWMTAKIESIGEATRHSDFTHDDDGIESFNFLAWIVLWIFACSFEVVNDYNFLSMPVIVICIFGAVMRQEIHWLIDILHCLCIYWISMTVFVRILQGYNHGQTNVDESNEC